MPPPPPPPPGSTRARARRRPRRGRTTCTGTRRGTGGGPRTPPRSPRGRALRAIRAEEEEAKHAVAAAGETRARRARAQATHRLHRREAPGVRARERDRLGRRRRGRHRDRGATEARAREPPRRRARNRATNDAQPRAPGRIRATSDDATRPGGSESVGRTTRRDRHFVGSHRRSIVGSILQLDARRSADTHTLVVLLPSLSHVAPTPSPPRSRRHRSRRAAAHLSPRRVILPFVPSFLRASVDHPRRRPARFAGPVRIPSVARAALLPGSYGVRRPPLLFSSPPLSEPSEPSSALFLLARIARPSLCDGDARSPSTLRWSPPTRRASSETSPSATRSFPVFSSAFRSRLVLSPSRPPPGASMRSSSRNLSAAIRAAEARPPARARRRGARAAVEEPAREGRGARGRRGRRRSRRRGGPAFASRFASIAACAGETAAGRRAGGARRPTRGPSSNRRSAKLLGRASAAEEGEFVVLGGGDASSGGDARRRDARLRPRPSSRRNASARGEVARSGRGRACGGVKQEKGKKN